MKKSNAYIPLILVVLGVVVVGSIWAWDLVFPPHELIAWRSDLAAAKKEAAQSHKPILLYIGATWCGPCQSMRRTTWTSRDVAEAVDHWIPVHLDLDANQELATSLGAKGIPFFVAMDADGQLIGQPATGSMGATQFSAWLRGKEKLRGG